MNKEEILDKVRQLQEMSDMLKGISEDSENVSIILDEWIKFASNPFNALLDGELLEKEYTKRDLNLKMGLLMFVNKLEVFGKCMDEFSKEK